MVKFKVSIIIPVYNTEDYLSDTLDSILNQTLHDIEIIVINDGSTDRSYQIMKEYELQDSRIRVINQENKGLSESRNQGIKHARGEYIYFIDSDDLLSPDALYNCYEKCKSNALDFVFFDAEIFGDVPNMRNFDYQRTHLIDGQVSSGINMLQQLLIANGFQASACLNFINLSFLKRKGLTFYPNIIHEDELFTFLLYLNAGRVSFIPEAYFKRRLRSNSIITTKFSRKNIGGYFTVASELTAVKNKTDSEETRQLIDMRLSIMIPGILYASRDLNIKDRYYVVLNCISHFKKYVSWRYILLTLFPLSQFKNIVSPVNRIAG